MTVGSDMKMEPLPAAAVASPTLPAAAAAAAAASPPAQLHVAPTRQFDNGVRPAVVLGAAAALVAGIVAVAAPFITPGVLRSFGVPFNPTEAQKLQAMLRYLPATKGLLRASSGRVATHRRSNIIMDLGSGDGRIVIAAARQGYHAVGYEFNPWLVLYSRLSSLAGGVSPLFVQLRSVRETIAVTLKRKVPDSRGIPVSGTKVSISEPLATQRGCARFVCGNMWKAPISDAACVVIYGVEELMPRFARKLEQELPLKVLPADASADMAAATYAGKGFRSRDEIAPVVVLCNTFPLPGSHWEERLAACEEGVYVYRYWACNKTRT